MLTKDRIHSFETGEKYPFLLKNIVLFDDEHYFVLEYEHYKFMLPAGQYHEYGFKKGDRITCKIDKINCAGKIFIEPEHPLYKENSFLRLKPKRYLMRENLFGEKICMVILEDHFGKLHLASNCIIPPNERNSIVNLKIIRIRKGKLILDIPESWQQINTLRPGHSYIFEVLQLQIIDKKKYIILMDPYGKKHGLDWHLYAKYNILNQSQIECLVIRFNSMDRFILEPRHPCYQKGLHYPFAFKILDTLGNFLLLEITDCFFNRIEFIISSDAFMLCKEMEKIHLEVKDIRKGIPVF